LDSVGSEYTAFFSCVLNTDAIDELSKVTAHKLEANLADFVSLDPIGTSHTVNKSWTAPLLVTTSVFLIVVVIYYCMYTHGSILLKCCGKESPSPGP